MAPATSGITGTDEPPSEACCAAGAGAGAETGLCASGTPPPPASRVSGERRSCFGWVTWGCGTVKELDGSAWAAPGVTRAALASTTVRVRRRGMVVLLEGVGCGVLLGTVRRLGAAGLRPVYIRSPTPVDR